MTEIRAHKATLLKNNSRITMCCGHTMLTARSHWGVVSSSPGVSFSARLPTGLLLKIVSFSLFLITIGVADKIYTGTKALTRFDNLRTRLRELEQTVVNKSRRNEGEELSQWEDRRGWAALPQNGKRGLTTQEYTLLLDYCVEPARLDSEHTELSHLT